MNEEAKIGSELIPFLNTAVILGILALLVRVFGERAPKDPDNDPVVIPGHKPDIRQDWIRDDLP